MVSDLRLRIDHIMVLSSEPERTLGTLEQAGLPVLSPVQSIAGGAMRSGLVRCGAVDLEVLAVGSRSGPVMGYGVGFVADGEGDLVEVSARLRAMGLPTSTVVRSRAVSDRSSSRSWQVIQVAGLLPEPFPVAYTERPPGVLERMSTPLLSALIRIPAVARRAMRAAGSSMVVVTAYDFDVAAWRATVPAGPTIVEAEIGVSAALAKWTALGPLNDGPRLVLDSDGPPGLRRLTLAGEDWPPDRPPVQLGTLTLAPAP